MVEPTCSPKRCIVSSARSYFALVIRRVLGGARWLVCGVDECAKECLFLAWVCGCVCLFVFYPRSEKKGALCCGKMKRTMNEYMPLGEGLKGMMLYLT
jgi:hypothetical protein